MKTSLLGALKAASPFLFSLALVGLDALFGAPVDLDVVKTLVVGAFTGVVVYLVPNLQPAAK